MTKSIGSGKIVVRLKADSSERFDTGSILCKGIEFYGDRIAFSDNDGDLIRHEGKVLELSMSDVFSIKA